MPAVTECPNCDARLDLKTQDKFGKRVRCPQCREAFTAEPVGTSQESSQPLRESRAASASGRRMPARQGESGTATARQKEKTSSKLKPLMIGGAAVFGIVVIGGIVVSQFMPDDDAVSPTTGETSRSGTAQAAIPSASISEDDAQAFADALEQAVASGDRHTFSRLINYDSIVDRALAGIDVPQKIKDQFKAGVINGSAQLAAQVLNTVRTGGSYRVVNHRTQGDVRRVLFRLNGDSGLNYHLFDLMKVDGETRASDMFVALTGEYISSTLRRIFIPLAQQANRSVLDRLLGNDKAMVEHWPTIEKLQRAFQSGQYQVGMNNFNKLPPELQREKFILILRFQGASADPLSSEYAAAMGAFRAAHPDSVAANFMAIDYFLLKKEYSKSLAAIEKLDEFTQGDPYLNLMRGNVTLLSGDASGAQKAMKPMLDHPDFGSEATTNYLDVVIALRDHQATLDTLLALETKHGLQFSRTLQGVEGFEAFARSPQHDEFEKR